MPWETIDDGWETVKPDEWETVEAPAPAPTPKPFSNVAGSTNESVSSFLQGGMEHFEPAPSTPKKTTWETLKEIPGAALQLPHAVVDEIVGTLAKGSSQEGLRMELAQAQGDLAEAQRLDPESKQEDTKNLIRRSLRIQDQISKGENLPETHTGQAAEKLKNLMVASPVMIPVYLAKLAEKAGVPGAGFLYGAQDEVISAGTALGSDPAMALLPAHKAIALAFIPGVAKDLGVSAKDLWNELQTNGFKPTEEMGRKLAKTATGAAFLGLLAHGALGGNGAVPETKPPTEAPPTLGADMRGSYQDDTVAILGGIADKHIAEGGKPQTLTHGAEVYPGALPDTRVVIRRDSTGKASAGALINADGVVSDFASVKLNSPAAGRVLKGLEELGAKAPDTTKMSADSYGVVKNLVDRRGWKFEEIQAPRQEAPLGLPSTLETKNGEVQAGEHGGVGEGDQGSGVLDREGSLTAGQVDTGPERAPVPGMAAEEWRPVELEELGDSAPVVPGEALEANAAAGEEGALTIGRAIEKDKPTVRDPQYENLLANRRAALEPPGFWEGVKDHFSPEQLKTYFLDRMAAAKNLAADTEQAVRGAASGGPPELEPNQAPSGELNPFQLLKQDPRVILDLATNTAARPAWLTETLATIVKPMEKAGIKADVKQWLDLNAWSRRFTAAHGEIAGLEAKLPFAEEGARMRRAVGGKESGLGRRREQLQLEGKIREAQGRKDFTLAKILKSQRDQIYRQRLASLPAKLSPARIEELVKLKRTKGYKDARDSVAQGEQKLGQTYHQLRELIKNSRTLRESAESPLKPIQDRIELLQQQISNGGMVPQNYTEAQVKALLDKQRATLGPERMKAVEAAGNSILEIPERLLALQHKTGIISDAQYQAVKALGKGYVPMFRLQEALASSSKGEWGTGNLLSLSERKFLMKFEGSKLDTMDPIQATYLVSLRAFSDLARQETANSLIAMHKQAAAAGLDLGFKKLRSSDPHGPRPTITRFVKGVKETWSLPESMTPVVEALKEPGPSGLMLSVLEKSRGWLQAGAVGLSLPFTVRNLPRDFGRSVYMVGKYLAPETLPKGFGLRTTYALGKLVETMVGVLRKDPKIMKQYQDALWNRALGNTLSFEIAGNTGSSPALEVPGFEREMTGLRGIPKAVAKGLVSAMSAGARYSEISSKLMGWRMLEEGMKKGRAGIPVDPKKRAWIVQQMIGTPPSNVRGSFAREGNVFLMFGNVAAQGWRTSWERTLRDPRGTLGRTSIAAIGLGTALVAWNNQFKQPESPDKPEWDKIPPEMKRDNWLLLLPATNPVTGRHEFLKIAKPEFVKAFFNVVENVIWDFATKNKPDWAQVGMDATTELANPLGFNIDIHRPGAAVAAAAGKLNPALKAPLELAGNFQTFKGTPIESQQDLRVAPAERFDERTSPTAVVVGQATGTSPKKLEYLARTFGAGLADAVLSVTDLAARPFSPQPSPARPSPERIPVLSSLIKTLWDYGFRDAEREKNLQDYYSRKGEVDQSLATYARVKKNDKSKDRASQYLEGSTFQSLKAEADYLDQRGEQINEIYKKLRAAPTEAQALVLNQKLNQVLLKIQTDVKRRAAVRAAQALSGPPSTPPPSTPSSAE